ncbi:uncharacterized protein [Argopecten irradians]|uniref:uncharacterized protein n=1 Tax=Argopecten irradians TaxID=31199 RepID=UPI003715E9BB
MNPYGTKWRCKGKNLPTPENGHVTTPLLRLDSIGEITSESSSTGRYLPDMGAIIDSAFKEMHKRMNPRTKRTFMDCSSTSNVMPLSMDRDFLLNQIKQQQFMTMDHSKTSPYAAPHWGCNKRIAAQPGYCAFSNFRSSPNSCKPEVKNFNFRNQKTGFHPAMTGHHIGQYPNKTPPHRCQSSNGYRSNRRPRRSFPSESPSDCTNWRKSAKENSCHDCPVHQHNAPERVQKPVLRSDDTSQTMSHSKSVENADCMKEIPKPVINVSCAMQIQEQLQEVSSAKMEEQAEEPSVSTTDSENDKVSNGEKSKSVQIVDWFECGQSERNGVGSEIPQRIGFRVRTLSLDSDSSSDPSIVNNKTLQREASVLSDIFQPDDTVYHLTCMFKENDSVINEKRSENSIENHQNECPSSPKENCSEDVAERTNTDSQQNTKCDAEKKIEPDSDKDCARRIVLLVRNNNKKGCRPSAKKRRRSKARKEDPTQIPNDHQKNNAQSSKFQERKCNATNSRKTSVPQKLGSTNTVAFVLGIDSNTSTDNSLKQHSFLVSFDSDSDISSEDSGDEFSDSDGVDELDFFSCPLQLNVICPVSLSDATSSPQKPSPSKSCESEESQNELKDINLKWSMNFSIIPQEKSTSKVTFADEDKLCTVYEVEDEDRKGHWEEFVRDRERFQRRIADVEEVLKPVLSIETRDRVFDKYFKTKSKEG